MEMFNKLGTPTSQTSYPTPKNLPSIPNPIIAKMYNFTCHSITLLHKHGCANEGCNMQRMGWSKWVWWGKMYLFNQCQIENPYEAIKGPWLD